MLQLIGVIFLIVFLLALVAGAILFIYRDKIFPSTSTTTTPATNPVATPTTN